MMWIDMNQCDCLWNELYDRYKKKIIIQTNTQFCHKYDLQK